MTYPEIQFQRHEGRRMSDTILRTLAAGAAGAVLGWSANALTLGGRVDALESSIARLQQSVDMLALQRKAAP